MKDSYDIFVFTTDRDLGETHPYPNIQCDKWVQLNGINILYASPAYLSWKNFTHNIREIKADYVYINSMYSRYNTLYPLLIKTLGLTDSKLILAPRGMLKKTALQFKTTKKKAFLFLFKLAGIHKKIVFQATDEIEKNDIQKIFGNDVHINLIPNFSPARQLITRVIKKESGDLKIIFVGRIHPIKNLAPLLEYIRTLHSNILLTIIGAVEDEKYWAKCQQIIASLSNRTRVVIKKGVPNADIGNLIADHHILALPTEGENFGHAIFEALAVGRPVLISDQTPWRDLQAKQAGWDLPLNNPPAFVNVLKQVAEMDDANFQIWSKGAHQLAKDYIEKSNIKEAYLKLFS
ncbi:MAG: glycosyltransferase [Agriterribacter sp.]